MTITRREPSFSATGLPKACAEAAPRVFRVLRLVLRDERACAGARSRLARPGDAEAAAIVLLALDRYLAFEQRDDLARDGETQSDAVIGARQSVVNLPEAVKDVRERVARNADACVGDLNIPPIRA